ncbi:MAG: bifunctional 2-keto-4-hydroxyglutarate aldolase/2-keto-3-deoxy-6-phosphogluconate aldolase [Erysipelotrichaceae bacterium]|nr:bifunctional 2-keto-4-hydroxyglutarate aldolase/2-keto-3-deoxy-6-phosphogluconate aldolase [Erysipelotrichaceae bacterium]
MKKSEVMQQLRELKVVSVVRGDSEAEGYNISEACIKGGITAIEVAYTNAHAGAIIERLKADYPDALIGAGTVLDAPTARMAILAGATFVVSPSFNAETSVLCNRYGIPYIPGCMTVREIVEAMESGCEMIKLFPGSAFGPKYIGSLKSPLPQVSIMVTGGVKLDNAKEWLKSGADAVGVGGEFNKLGAKGDWKAIEEMAADYVKEVN